MLVAVIAAAVLCLLLGVGLHGRLGATAWAVAALVWSLVAIGVITLIPAQGAPGIVPAETRLATCSWDLGGPAPEGFWIFSGGQRLLNTVVFVPSGALLVLVAARWRSAWVAVPLGLAGLAAYSAAIEWTQLQLARLDRACDVTDLVDNVTGALLGAALGLGLAMVVRPWRDRPAGRA